MRKDIPNKLVKGVFSEDQVKAILDAKEKTNRSNLMPDVGHTAWHIDLPDEIINIFNTHAESIAGEPLDLLAYQYARYENHTDENGNKVVPILFPHTDEVFEEPRFTFDYQVRSNTSWAIHVDNWESEQEFMLKDNDAVTFSGTHQIHWRPKKDFQPGEFIDMIFLHYRPKSYENITLDHYNQVRARAKSIYEVWKLDAGVNGNGTPDELEKQEMRYEPRGKM